MKDMLQQLLIDHIEEVKDLEANDQISADIFHRMEQLPLTDKYAAYQILADNWASIMGDIEIIQSEGIGACTVVEPKYKMTKDKAGNEIEVPDGEKGRIMPFELVQKTYFQEQLAKIQSLSERIEAINGEIDAIKDEFDTDEQEVYLDSEKDGALDKKKITADAKPKADVEDETKQKLVQIVTLWDEQGKAKKQLVNEVANLVTSTKQKIESLDMHEINHLLYLKWILPITSAIESMPDAIIQALADALQALKEKYAVTYNDIEQQLTTSHKTLAELIGQLTGDEFAIEGLNELIKG
jgi:type I restriction enzyme M protein